MFRLTSLALLAFLLCSVACVHVCVLLKSKHTACQLPRSHLSIVNPERSKIMSQIPFPIKIHEIDLKIMRFL